MQVATLKQPKKKFKIWPFILIGSLLLLIVLPIALVYGFLYDGDTKKLNVKDDTTLAEIGNRVMVDSIDNAPTSKKMEIAMTENDMDNLLHVALKKASLNNKIVKKAYMYVKGNRYTFYVDLDVTVLKSRLKIITLMEENEDKSAFVFKIKDIVLGRLSGLGGPAKSLVKKYVNEETIGKFLADAGMSVTFNSNEMTLTYKKTDIINDIQKLNGNSSTKLYFDIMDTMLENNMVHFDINTDNFIESYVDLAPLETNEMVTDDAKHIKVQPDEVVSNCKEDLLVLVSEGSIGTDESSLKTGFNFLFSGYEALSDSEKSFISGIDMSTINIDDVTTYKGFDLLDGDKIIDKMKTTIDGPAIINDHSLNLCSLFEEDVNSYIAGRSIVGFTTLLHRPDGDGYKVNFITIDNFYLNIYSPTTGDRAGKNVAEMVCKINVNGFHTSLTFDTLMDDEGLVDNSMIFNVKDIKFGNIEANNLKEEFFTIIQDALNGEGSDSSLHANKENQTITVDFKPIINYAKTEIQNQLTAAGKTADVEATFNAANILFDVVGESRDDDGDIKLTLKEPLVVH